MEKGDHGLKESMEVKESGMGERVERVRGCSGEGERVEEVEAGSIPSIMSPAFIMLIKVGQC